jgi:uncharacterized membrane protein
MRHFKWTVIAFFTALFPASGVSAGLSICNQTDVPHSLAVAYKDGDVYLSKGWWNLDPNECKIVVGGDLERRYYYFRATASGLDYENGKYSFCTETDVFNISGDENCEARGYNKDLFKKLDTGKSAKDFTLNLVPIDPVSTPSEDAPDPDQNGEPYADNVIFHECVFSDEGNFCSFHASGAKFFIYDDGQTPQWIISDLRQLDYGTPLFVEGNLLNVYDRTAVVTLRDVVTRPYSRNDRLLNKLSGYWYAVDDPNAQFNIIGAEREHQYDEQLMGLEYLSVQDFCDEFSGAGPYLSARDEASGETYCYAIEEIGDFEMTLIYLPRGNTLKYRKLD